MSINKKTAAGPSKCVPGKSAVTGVVTKVQERCGLSVREAAFVDHYLVSFAVGRSYIEAGFKAKTPQSARAAGSRLLASVNARRYLAQRSKAMFSRLEEEQDAVLRALTYVAFADPRELVEYWRFACRHCHGKMHRYQYTAGEWDKLMTAHTEKQEKAAEGGMPTPKAPDQKGGVGYSISAEPNDDCPECGGVGEGRTIVKDTRHLSPAALTLYAGTKQTKDGIEVLMHDQMRARETLAKIRKMFDDSTTINVSINAAELDALYGEAMRKGAERMATMRNERLAYREARENGLGATGFVPSKASA